MTPDQFMALKSRIEFTAQDARDLIEYAESLESKNATLRKELAWYGNEKNWKRPLSVHGIGLPMSEIQIDRGQRAREALGGK